LSDSSRNRFSPPSISGIGGKLVSLKDSLEGCERILHDEFKDYPENALYMIGKIDEAKTEAKVGAKAKAKAKAKTDTDAEADAEAKVGAKANARSEVEHATDGTHES